MTSEINVADHESVEEKTLDKEGGLEIDSEGKVTVCTYGFDIKDRLTDLTFIVEGRHLYVTRVMLEVFSSVFGDLFKCKLDETDASEVEIPDANYKDFAEFLACMYPNKQHRVSQSNVFSILPLAFQYSVDFLMDESEVVLTGVTSQTEDEEYLIRCLESAKRFGLPKLRQHCIDMFVKKRRENIERLDNEINTGDKVAIYDELMPQLRSEVCKIKFLSSDTENIEVWEMTSFSNAKYKQEEFSFNLNNTIKGNSDDIIKCLTTEVWNLKLTVTVETKGTNYTRNECNLILTLEPSSITTKSCYVAIKFVLQNSIPGRQKMCLKQVQRLTQGSRLVFPLDCKTITNYENGFMWNGEYMLVMHILVNKPQ